MPTNPRKGTRQRPAKSPEVLRGAQEIALYLGIGYNTVGRWIKYHGLPATKTPGGEWLTTKRAITAWVFAGHEALVLENNWDKARQERGICPGGSPPQSPVGRTPDSSS